ncbi:ATPase [Alcanivorax hongdengensis A-11-3]|uniref:ATPase n=1 Tax=Alcanivorax hongdengensis A-11-3 TaxID=1177179 RepID=L0WBJ1_9GAMM|nr:hypothetical protein [Alcanivorax hongdengensis]EKF74331.1 ATPase [Alcanivorax hongdengensis A-11-3]
MNVETIADVIHWSREVHRQLAECMERGWQEESRERVRMLMAYISDHERRLDAVLKASEADAGRGTLNTWFYDYVQANPEAMKMTCSLDGHTADTNSLLAYVLEMHEVLIRLYRYLAGRAHVETVREELDALLSLEEHEAMRMARDAQRLDDL